LAVAQMLAQYNLTADELPYLEAGMHDKLTSAPLQVKLDDYQKKLHVLMQKRTAAAAERERAASQEFLQKAAAEKGAVKTESGLIYTELKPGTGERPKATDTVKVHYRGTLRDGTVFDSSIARGKPATFPLNRVIKCWTEGVQRMKVGGKSKLVCPAKLAYGNRGAPPKIKPGAALVFDVELLDIVKK